MLYYPPTNPTNATTAGVPKRTNTSSKTNTTPYEPGFIAASTTATGTDRYVTYNNTATADVTASSLSNTNNHYRITEWDAANANSPIAELTGSGSSFPIPDANINQTEGSTTWYRIWSARTAATGGSGVFGALNSYFWIKRRFRDGVIVADNVENEEAAQVSIRVAVANTSTDRAEIDRVYVEKSTDGGSNWGSRQTYVWPGGGSLVADYTVELQNRSDTNTLYRVLFVKLAEGSNTGDQLQATSNWTDSGIVNIGYIAPGDGVSCDSQSVGSTVTSVSVPVVDGLTNEDYAISATTGLSSANVESNAIQTLIPYAGTGFTVSGSNLPAANATKNYYLYARRPTNKGGDNGWDEIGTFSITKSEGLSAPTATEVTVDNPDSETYTATFTLSSTGSGGTLQYAIEKDDSTPDNWTDAPTNTTTSFTANFSRSATPGTIYARARRLESASVTADSSVVSVAGRSYTAPVVNNSQTFATTAAASTSCDVSLSTSPLPSATLEYNKSTSTTAPTSGWQSSNTITGLTRGTSYYLWARIKSSNTYADRTNSALLVPYLAADTEITATSPVIAFNATSATVTISNVARSTETVLIRVNGDSNNIASRQGNGDITITAGLPTQGNETTYRMYTVRAESTGGDVTTAYDTGDLFTIEREAGVTYSVNAPNSMNEGATAQVIVSTTNVGSATLYWRVAPSSDFTSEEGPVTITGDNGTFNITTVADGFTEGAETGTVYLYTDSSRTNLVASDTFTINDTSAGTVIPYGLEVYNSSAIKVLSISDRVGRFVISGSTTIDANSSSFVPIPGMQNNDTWNVLGVGGLELGGAGPTFTKSSGGFTITNPSSQQQTFNYWVVNA